MRNTIQETLLAWSLGALFPAVEVAEEAPQEEVPDEPVDPRAGTLCCRWATELLFRNVMCVFVFRCGFKFRV